MALDTEAFFARITVAEVKVHSKDNNSNNIQPWYVFSKDRKRDVIESAMQKFMQSPDDEGAVLSIALRVAPEVFAHCYDECDIEFRFEQRSIEPSRARVRTSVRHKTMCDIDKGMRFTNSIELSDEDAMSIMRTRKDLDATLRSAPRVVTDLFANVARSRKRPLEADECNSRATSKSRQA